MIKSKLGWILGIISVVMVLLDIPGWAIPWGYLVKYLYNPDLGVLLFFVLVTASNFVFYYLVGFAIEEYLKHKAN